MADYLVTDTELTSIADAIRAKNGENAEIEFPTEFVSEIQGLQVLDTSDATANEYVIMNGYTAYVNGHKITGTLLFADRLTVQEKEIVFEKVLTSSVTVRKNSQTTIQIPMDLTGTGAVLGGNLPLEVGSVTTDVQNFYTHFSITERRVFTGSSPYVRLTIKEKTGVDRYLDAGCYFRATVTLCVSSYIETEEE